MAAVVDERAVRNEQPKVDLAATVCTGRRPRIRRSRSARRIRPPHERTRCVPRDRIQPSRRASDVSPVWRVRHPSAKAEKACRILTGIGRAPTFLPPRHVVRARADSTDVGRCERSDEFVEPAGGNDGVAVQEHDDITPSLRRPLVTSPGESLVLVVRPRPLAIHRSSATLGSRRPSRCPQPRPGPSSLRVGRSDCRHRSVCSQAFHAGITMVATGRPAPDPVAIGVALNRVRRSVAHGA